MRTWRSVRVSRPPSVLVGQPTTFTVVVTNHGPARVTGLVVQDLLPAGLSFVSASASQGSYADATGAWTIGTLLNAQSATLTLAATVTVAGAITNRALVVARDQPDPVASNNSAAAIVNGAANADVGVTQDRRQAGAVGGRNRDVHGDGGQQRAESGHRGGRHRCAARGPDARVGHAVAGHLHRAQLDRRHAQRDGPAPTPR